MSNFHVVESSLSTWSYHISETPEGQGMPKPLCGKRTIMMRTKIPLAAWGTKSQLNEQYCDKCLRIYQEATVVSD